MLDGGLPDLELGAALATLGTLPGDSLELLGFNRALHERVRPLATPVSDIRPVVIPSYGSVRDQFNLVPLVAMLLARVGIPVVVHGTLEGSERISSAAVFRELGLMPCTTAAQIEAVLESQCLAFVPTGLLSPGLAKLIALRGRLGVPPPVFPPPSAHSTKLRDICPLPLDTFDPRDKSRKMLRI